MNERVLLLDGAGMMVRCNRAGRHRGLAHNGERTGPLLMFISSLARQLREHKPSHVLVAWDGIRSLEWRRSVFPGYKAGRDHCPAGREFALAQEFCAAACITQKAVSVLEGDDLIAMSVAWAQRCLPGIPIVICSDDADLHQLLTGDVVQVPLSGSIEHSQDWAEMRYGCSGSRIPQLRALAGDSSDGIPGVRGIGPKKALSILASSGWAWPPALDSQEDVAMACLFRQILDLELHPGWAYIYPECFSDPFSEVSRFDPDGALKSLEFLKRYNLSSLVERAEKGTLW